MRNRIKQLLSQNMQAGAGIRASATDAGVEVLVYDVIDPWFGVSAAAFHAAIKDAGDAPLTVRINSPGGDAFEGRAIASLIRNYKGPTRAVVDGLAASAASTIAIAAHETAMASGAFLMVHNAWIFAMGNAGDLRQTADLLTKIDGELAADYAKRADVTVSQAAEWMAAETWFTAQEAVDAKLADVVLANDAQFSAWNLSAFDRAPKALTDRIEARASGPTLEEIRAGLERKVRLLAIPS